jgi:CubicO group peptidase (beta-lactamase class C family)
VQESVRERAIVDPRVDRLDRYIPQLLRKYKAAGVGVAIIDHGNLTWADFYGEQSPGKPASFRTVFNVASIAKTVTAETLIALAAKGLISLDEPIYPYVIDKDLSSDPRFKKLTCRILLSHQSGLLNWPYEYADGHARFVAEPGTKFGYSGMGVELAAQFAESKLGKDFEALAFEYVLTPLGISEMSLGRIKPWMDGRLAMPMDAKGKFFAIADGNGRLSRENLDGRWSAADDLLTTVDSYAQFLIGVIKSAGLDKQWIAQRTQILTSLVGDPIWNCQPDATVLCASEYGHGIGWMVYRFGSKTVVKHGGNDEGENALAIYCQETGNGAVIFVNGANGVFVSTQILDLIGDQPEIAAYYRQLVQKFYKVRLPRLQTRSMPNNPS